MPRHTRAVSRPLSMQSVRATLDAIRTCSGVSCAPTASWPGGLQGAVPCPRRQRTRRARSPRELRSDLRRWRSVTETLHALISDQDDALQHTQSRFFRGKVYISTPFTQRAAESGAIQPVRKKTLCPEKDSGGSRDSRTGPSRLYKQCSVDREIGEHVSGPRISLNIVTP